MAPRGGGSHLMAKVLRLVTISAVTVAFLLGQAECSNAVPAATTAHVATPDSARFPAARWLGGEDQLIRSFSRHRHQHLQHKFRFDDGDDEPDSDTPFQWSAGNAAGVVAAAVCAMLANATGLGGGPFFQVIFNLVMGFDLRLCAGLSHTVVAIGALAAVLYGLLQPSPTDPSKPLLNFDLAMVLVPSMLFGISFGVVLCPLSPEWVQTVLLSVLLMAVTHKTFSHGMIRWQQEQHERACASNWLLRPCGFVSTLKAEFGGALADVADWQLAGKYLLRNNAMQDIAAQQSSRSSAASGCREWGIAQPNSRTRSQVAALASLWMAFVGLQLAKAQHHHCTWAYFGLVLGQGAVLAGFAAAFAYRQALMAQRGSQTVDPEFLKMMAQPAAPGSPHVSISSGGSDGSSTDTRHDFSATEEAVVYQPVRVLHTMGVVAAAGVVAGMLGIAGAMLFNPFLLAIGVHPQVVAATAIVIVLFGSGAISLSFMSNGMLNMSYLAVFAPIVFVASLVGVTLLSWAIRRTGRQSVLLFLMGSILALGLVSVVLFGGQHTVADIRGGRRIGFNSLCDD